MSAVTELAGELLMVGFHGGVLPADVGAELAAGALAGVVLFRRNLEAPAQIAALNAAIYARSPNAIVAVDQEGGRVARLGPPCLRVPAAMTLARGGAALCQQAGLALGAELAALGFSLNFAPVLDVHSNPHNPIIGDRAFGHSAGEVIAHALPFARGLMAGGVDACGKHFPGHGDTDKDSHLELPHVERSAQSLKELELVPFAAALELPALMSAHVRYPALDAQSPATLSAAIATELLRTQLSYQGVLCSDDLEMKALDGAPEDHAVAAVLAGCDLLLVCSDRASAGACAAALRREIERSQAFRARATEAAARTRRLRERRNAPDLERFLALTVAHAPLQRQLSALAEPTGAA